MRQDRKPLVAATGQKLLLLHAPSEEPVEFTARGQTNRGAQGRRRPLWLCRRMAKSGWRASPTHAMRAAQAASLRPGRDEALSSLGPQTYHQSGVTRQTGRVPEACG